MDGVIGPIILGIFSIALGVSNMKGNLSSIHWYHRQRVTEENIIPFGKLVGLGTIVIGISVILFGVLLFAAQLLQADILTTLGSVIVIIGIVVGIALNLYAMMKYNKGIF